MFVLVRVCVCTRELTLGLVGVTPSLRWARPSLLTAQTLDAPMPPHTLLMGHSAGTRHQRSPTGPPCPAPPPSPRTPSRTTTSPVALTPHTGMVLSSATSGCQEWRREKKCQNILGSNVLGLYYCKCVYLYVFIYKILHLNMHQPNNNCYSINTSVQ